MRKMLACAAALAWACGCQAGYRSGAPDDLDRRLARIEAQRLSSVASVAEGAAARAHSAPHGPSSVEGDALRPTRGRGERGVGWWEGGGEEPWAAVRVGESSAFELSLSDVGEQSEASAPVEGLVRSGPMPSLWETIKRDVKDMPSDLWRDTKRVYANPVNLVILGAAYGGSLALQEGGPDDTIEHHYNRDHDWRAPRHSFDSDWRDAFGAVGNPGTHFAVAGLWYLVGQQAQSDKTYEVGKTLFSALIINDLTVLAGQTATWDKGPNGEWGAFPSGHTSSAFVVASVMHEAYGHLVGIPLYGLATLVSVERLDDREHYFSDVAMGAVLGTVIGHAVASGRNPEFFGWKLLPYASPGGGSGLALMKTTK